MSCSSPSSRITGVMPAALFLFTGTCALNQAQGAVVYFPATTPEIIDTSRGGLDPYFYIGNINIVTGFTVGSDTAPNIGMGFLFFGERPEFSAVGAEFLVWSEGGSATDLLEKLGVGQIIGASGAYASFGVPEELNMGPWNGVSGASTQYLGFRIGTPLNYHYGWVDLGYDDFLDTFTFKGLALETTPNASIVAGVVPEPANVALLLSLGAAACVAGRRRPRMVGPAAE